MMRIFSGKARGREKWGESLKYSVIKFIEIHESFARYLLIDIENAEHR